MPRHSSLIAFMIGAGVTLGAAGLGELLAWLAGSGPGPVEAVATWFIGVAPPALIDFAIENFGSWNKYVLGLGICVVLAFLGGLGGLAERAGRARGVFLIAVISLIGAGAISSLPEGGIFSTWPVAVAGLVGGLILFAVLAPPREQEPISGMRRGLLLDRRQLVIAAAVIGGIAVAGSFVLRSVTGTQHARPRLDVPAPVEKAPPVTAASDMDIDGITAFQTPTRDFYRIDTAFSVPQVDPEDWQLRVHGLVEQEVILNLQELLAEPLIEAWATLVCVSNEVGGDLIGNARWLGLPIRTVLERAGVEQGADMVLSRSIDGFTASTPLSVLTDERNALLAVGMNGRDLPAEHGYPVRMVVPGLYGYVSATKWVTELEVTRFSDETAYWTDRGWAPLGPVKLSSRIDVPRLDRQLVSGEVLVAGVAWAQHVGIGAVEVRVDGGRWQPAELSEEISVDSWLQWFFPWHATSGAHTLEARAISHNGEIQSEKIQGTVPDGATGLHSITVYVS